MAHYRKFQNYETKTGGCIPSKNNIKTQKTKSRWLASNITFKLLHTGCLIAHVKITAKVCFWVKFVSSNMLKFFLMNLVHFIHKNRHGEEVHEKS